MTAVVRASLVALCLLFAASAPAGAQQAADWKRGTAKGVEYGSMESGISDFFGFFCRKVENRFVGGIVMKMPVFRTLIRDGESYSLNIVIDGARDSIIFRAKDIDLWFEAKDLNQQLALSRLFEAIKASNRLQMGIAAIGWRNSYDYNNAAEALEGLMDKCL